MNLAFRQEVVPAFYQFPMDDNRWDVGRFDDIWSGLTLKRACDVLRQADIQRRPALSPPQGAPVDVRRPGQ